MSAGAWAVVVLSLLGLFAELAGIVLVAGRWPEIARRLRGPQAQTLQVSGVPAGSTVGSPTLTNVGASEIERLASRVDAVEARARETSAELRQTNLNVHDLARDVEALRRQLPGAVREHAKAPMGGIALLFLGLACFVAANVVGVLT